MAEMPRYSPQKLVIVLCYTIKMEPQRPQRDAKEESDILKGLSNQIIGCAIKVHTI